MHISVFLTSLNRIMQTKEDISFHFQNIAHVSSLILYTSSFLEAPSCVIMGSSGGRKVILAMEIIPSIIIHVYIK